MKKIVLNQTSKAIFWNLELMNEVTRHFLLTSKLWPPGAVCPCPGAIYMYKIMKKLYKMRLQRDVFETCNNWPKWQDVPVNIKILFPRGCQPLPRGYIHVLNHEKKCKKSDFREIFFKLVANDRSDKRFLLTSKFCPLGLSAPDLRLYTFINSWKEMYKFRGWRVSENCNKWP